MKKFYILILLILLVFIQFVYARNNSHKFLYLDGNAYCSYCHKLRKSYNINPLWGANKVFNYISPIINLNVSKKNSFQIIDTFNNISSTCISCHSDYIEHSSSFHPVSVSVKRTKKHLKKMKIYNKKIDNKLPLYGNNDLMACSTCHDPHTKEVKLLRDLPEKLCVDCHER
ncbi:cytochrome c3 family protein [Deferribacter thermophilus]|uniref:cytochrome c3 family protein n=1 Tax=Deferribacter thermophilus TaxID=53573 RepID=UPI003C1E7C70